MTSCNCNNQCVVRIRQGDDSSFNGNNIVFHIVTELDISNWKARFQLQDVIWDIDTITDNKVEIAITSEQSSSLELGRCYGWLQLIDENNNKGTIYAQPFMILQKEVG